MRPSDFVITFMITDQIEIHSMLQTTSLVMLEHVFKEFIFNSLFSIHLPVAYQWTLNLEK